jgi:hypothetical protein
MPVSGTPERPEELATSLAPVVLFDTREELWPMDPNEFVAQSTLCWRGEGGHVASCQPVDDSARLGGRIADPFVTAGVRTDEFTRPLDGSRERNPQLALEAGYSLEPTDPDATIKGDDAPEIPVFYEYSPGKRALTYWLFFGGSKCPHRLEQLLDFVRGELVLAAPEIDMDSLDGELRRNYPELYDKALRETSGVDQMEGVTTAGVVRDRIRRVANMIWDAAYSPPLMHDGDWERITIRLARHADEPEFTLFFQHRGSQPYAWAPSKTGRLEIYCALGSHASFPRPPRRSLDVANGQSSRRWETWRRLRPVIDEPWYGFGGAWGRVGLSSEGSGPLGPSPWKR